MSLPLYIVNAFTSEPFGGNPAAVVPLSEWLDDSLMQTIAAQHNLSETAFFAPRADGWDLRWFTPTTEVDLCGHATLATACVLHQVFDVTSTMAFSTRSGVLSVTPSASGYVMDLPAVALESTTPDAAVVAALGCDVMAAAKPVSNAWQWLYRVADETVLRALQPDYRALAAAVDYGVAVTAEGTHCDFVSRFFIPQLGVDEDPVTGSAHCLLAPYWARRLEKTRLSARQLSPRGGELSCEVVENRLHLRGAARIYARGELTAH